MGVVATNVNIISGGSSVIDLPRNLSKFFAVPDQDSVKIKWDYNDTADLNGLQIVYKTEAYPISPNDGTLEIVSDTETKEIIISGLENETEYFFRAYPYREINGEKYYQTCNYVCKASATPSLSLSFGYSSQINDSSVFVIPKSTWAEMGIGDSTEIHPMFKVNGKELDYIAIGRYEASIENDKIVSKKNGNLPLRGITYENALNNCKDIGQGWHLITRLEWAGIANWCANNGFLPTGNFTKGLGTTGQNESELYSHNKKLNGIYDMAGNIQEWNAGIRSYYGELQVISRDGTFNNDAADASIDQSDESPFWWAIDGTTGELIRPDGNGTTANSIKASISGNTWAMNCESGFGMSTQLNAVNVSDEICEKAKNILIALGLVNWNELTSSCTSIFYIGNDKYNYGVAGAGYNNKTNEGIYSFLLYYTKDYVHNEFGFRISYAPL